MMTTNSQRDKGTATSPHLFGRNDVSFVSTGARSYHQIFPYDPPERYPEYRGEGVDPTNMVYAGVRDMLRLLGMDAEHYGTPDWNPFAGIVRPGMTVFVKPNTVLHRNLNRGDVFSVITHASILRPILDYIVLALDGTGRIIIGDSQIIMGQYDKAQAISRISDLVPWYRERTSIPIECFDLRTVRGVRTWLYGRWGRKKVNQDPRGYTWVNVGAKSQFVGIDPARLRIAVSSYRETYKHHSDGKHEYHIPNSVLASDVIINIAKLKTHRRTGITLAIKNFMGIPASKESLPHFTVGSPEEGGDQYIHPSLRKRIGTHLHDIVQSHPLTPVKALAAGVKRLLWNTHKIIPFKDDVFEAMWPGNDTVWRTLLDLNRIVYFAGKDGRLHDTPQRNYWAFIDGIVGGEGDGPVAPDPVYAGVLLAGYNPIALDATASTMMGFDYEKIPLIMNAYRDASGSIPLLEGSLESIAIHEDEGVRPLAEFRHSRNLGFAAHPNWKGAIELEANMRSEKLSP